MNIMRKYIYKTLLIILSNFFCISSALASQNAVDNTKKVILISKAIAHPALDVTVQGLVDALSLAGYKKDVNVDLKIESVEANTDLAKQIAGNFVKQKPDLVVGVGTMAAQSFIKYADEDKLKLVFSSVTDPVAAGLDTGNITGVSNFIDLKPQLLMFKKLQPRLKRLGILYNPSESNSVSIVNKLAILLPQLKLDLITEQIKNQQDVLPNAIKLAAGVDAIFVSNDNMVLSALREVIRAGERRKIPVYVSDTDAVELGAVAALGPNQYRIGMQTGHMAVKVLNSSEIIKQAVEFPAKIDIYVNLIAAKKAGINIPKAIIDNATKVIK